MSKHFPLTPRYRRRLIERDAQQAASAIDNLRICLIKLATRATKVETSDDYPNAADLLDLAACKLGVALGKIDEASKLLRG